jgi:hypothetical protein
VDQLYEAFVHQCYALLKRIVVTKTKNVKARRVKKLRNAWSLYKYWEEVALMTKQEKLRWNDLSYSNSYHIIKSITTLLATKYWTVWDQEEEFTINQALKKISHHGERQEPRELERVKKGLKNQLLGVATITPPPIRVRDESGNVSTTDAATAQVFMNKANGYNVTTNDMMMTTVVDQLDPSDVEEVKQVLNDEVITEIEIVKRIAVSKSFTASGSDGIPMSFLKASNFPVSMAKANKPDTRNEFNYYISRGTSYVRSYDGIVRKGRNMFTSQLRSEPDDDNYMLKSLALVFKEVHEAAITPHLWNISHVTMLWKKEEKTDPANYRPISLMSNAQKTFHAVLDERIHDYLDQSNVLNLSQCGYRRKRNLNEHLITLLEFLKHCRGRNLPAWIAFVDIRKAFDGIKHSTIMKALQKIGISSDTRFYKYIMHMYNSLSFSVKVGSSYSTVEKQLVGIKQGCPLSPILFNIVFDQILKNIIRPWESEVKPLTYDSMFNVDHGVTGYADDAALMANERNQLITFIKNMIDLMATYGMEMNIGKTEVMVLDWRNDAEPVTSVSFTHRDKQYSFRCVDEFRYLGCRFNKNMMTTREILNQEYYDTLPMKGLANSYEQIMKNRSIPLTYKADVIRTNVYPTVLHSSPILGILYHLN